MSDTLAESARNRGLKLVRSRVRTRGKPRFGKVGLIDASDQPLFGMDDNGPTAKPEEVADYLRNFGANNWGASLDVTVVPTRKPAKHKAGTEPAASNDAEPEASPSLRRKLPAPKLMIRPAKGSDAAALSVLINLLQQDIDEKTLAKNLRQLGKLGEPPLVATLDEHVVGLCGIHKMVAIHRAAPVGRITILVVAEEARDRGAGRMLVEAAERWSRDQGCALLEVTSHDRLSAAHAFYRHLGFARTSIRFAKML